MQLDLNLLTVLDALLTEGSVMGAADRLHLSSPAVSRSLGRIRRLTGDDILVRTGRTMTPTPYAITIREQVSALVRQSEEVLRPSRDLDLATLERTFTLQCHDALTAALAPALLAATIHTAPGVRLRFLTEAAADTDDLRHGRVDLEIGASTPEQPEFRAETIGYDRLVVVVRPGHPYQSNLDLGVFAAQAHVLVSRRGRLSDPVDDLLSARGLRRRVLASVGSTASALRIVAGSDAVVIAAESTCRPLIEAFGLLTVPAPVELPPLPVVTVWHQRYDSEPGHAWLRDRVREALDQRFRDQLLR
ncbi:LysR family transcriptional regulator [Actinoplanes derwentensis]|uniref:DNA-binding transcriptional regulator, LysR family n=1 Tax=Actinoplanes derwentensis TaxID=113562 RepID=A0A1H1YDW0_9ACTN|nr:LysR family transcriptional regulator [Actinoplanes derwentensis]GID81105.1 LysR family transcriptional regulator [Actinoplanes derwentensis]SDT19571.1 DNA-binding transcriptional regulator, LysR family [Actinoplanes derwentensis]